MGLIWFTQINCDLDIIKSKAVLFDDVKREISPDHQQLKGTATIYKQ